MLNKQVATNLISAVLSEKIGCILNSYKNGDDKKTLESKKDELQKYEQKILNMLQVIDHGSGERILIELYQSWFKFMHLAEIMVKCNKK
jgi:hypothetical protein